MSNDPLNYNTNYTSNSCIHLTRQFDSLRPIGARLGMYILYDIFEVRSYYMSEYKLNMTYTHIEIWVLYNKNLLTDYEFEIKINKMVEGINLNFKDEED